MYAPAKRAYIFHDSYSFLSRGYGVVEFDRVESAIHTLSFANNIAVRGIQVRIGYANPQCVREAHNSVSTSTPFFPPTLPANFSSFTAGLCCTQAAQKQAGAGMGTNRLGFCSSSETK